MPVAAVRRGCHHYCTAPEREFPVPDHSAKTIADSVRRCFAPTFELFVGTIAGLVVIVVGLIAVSQLILFIDPVEQFFHSFFQGTTRRVRPTDVLDLVFGFRPRYLLLPPFVASIWLWLYAGSGFLLKAARRFDLGFQWFNRKFDIEKKPLQAIGLVAGSLVAIIYWGFALTMHLLHA